MTATPQETWEVIRRQVALCGRVTFADTGLPLSDAVVRLVAGPADRPATLRPGGVYFFLDLPAGRYTVTAADARRRWHGQAAGEVTWDQSGRVRPAVVDVQVKRRASKRSQRGE